jgi:hypothetical protein
LSLSAVTSPKMLTFSRPSLTREFPFSVLELGVLGLFRFWGNEVIQSESASGLCFIIYWFY